MWDMISLPNVYKRTYRMAWRPTGRNGIVVLLDGYDASLWLRYCSAVKIKQMKARLI